MSNLTILSKEIRQLDGLYCLNDLHKASGGEQKHRPKYFLENQQTVELSKEIQKGGISPFKAKRGKNGGTYACKQIVLAYGMWISSELYLAVINAFLEHQAQLPPQFLNDKQLKQIKDEVSRQVRSTGKHWQTLYHGLFDYVNAPSLREIRADDYLLACEHLGIEPLEGEYIPKAPEPSIDKDKATYLYAWGKVARYRQRQLCQLEGELAELSIKLRKISKKLYDPIQEPCFHLSLHADGEEATRRAQAIIENQEQSRF